MLLPGTLGFLVPEDGPFVFPKLKKSVLLCETVSVVYDHSVKPPILFGNICLTESLSTYDQGFR